MIKKFEEFNESASREKISLLKPPFHSPTTLRNPVDVLDEEIDFVSDQLKKVKFTYKDLNSNIRTDFNVSVSKFKGPSYNSTSSLRIIAPLRSSANGEVVFYYQFYDDLWVGGYHEDYTTAKGMPSTNLDEYPMTLEEFIEALFNDDLISKEDYARVSEAYKKEKLLIREKFRGKISGYKYGI